MVRAVADTHAFIWYLVGDKRLSDRARSAIDDAAGAGDTIAVSAISLVEAIYLAEKGHVPPETIPRLLAELGKVDGVFVEAAADHRIVAPMQQVAWAQVPDMPDRIVAATALYLGVPVISRDSRIQASGIETIW